MRSLADEVLDVWAPLSHKRRLNGVDETRDQPAWIELADWRRLNAYLLRRAYTSNVARAYIVNDGSRDEYREYGDPALFVAQARSAVLGNEQTIAVDGAEKYQPPRDDNDQPVDDPALPGWAEHQRQEWLRQWGDAEQLPARMLEGERQACGLGDNVYVLTWSTARRRPRLRVYDPGLYFPALNDDQPEDFPPRVHMLWEVDPRSRGGSPLLRRRTWELGGIEPITEQFPDERGVLRRVLAAFTGTAGPLALQPGDRMGPDGVITRRYPWQAADQPDSAVTCYYTDATWETTRLRGDWTVDSLPLSEATFEMTEDGLVADRIDLRLDFVPVVHVPNTVAGADHFGQSVIDMVAQVFDDLSATDTDVQRAGVLAGTPVIGLAGVGVPEQTGGTQTPMGAQLAPGQIWGLGENGRMSPLDMSPQLAALMQLADRLRDLASENGRIPQALLGRVKPSEVPSGFALALGFSPFDSLLAEMRLVRREKYALLLKMVQRLAQAAGTLPAGATPRAEMRFGAHLPANLGETIDQVVAMLAARAVSLETGLTILQHAGLPVEDVQAEADRIRRADFAAAQALFEATGDTDAVRELLGLAGPGPTPLPDLQLTGAGQPEQAGAAEVPARGQ